MLPLTCSRVNVQGPTASSSLVLHLGQLFLGVGDGCLKLSKQVSSGAPPIAQGRVLIFNKVHKFLGRVCRDVVRPVPFSVCSSSCYSMVHQVKGASALDHVPWLCPSLVVTVPPSSGESGVLSSILSLVSHLGCCSICSKTYYGSLSLGQFLRFVIQKVMAQVWDYPSCPSV